MKYVKEKSLIGLGILLVLLPLTGFPRDWKVVINVIIGVCVIYIGALFFKKARTIDLEETEMEEIKAETFTETA